MKGLRLRKIAPAQKLHSNSFHNKMLFPLQKLLSCSHYTSHRIQETNILKHEHNDCHRDRTAAGNRH